MKLPKKEKAVLEKLLHDAVILRDKRCLRCGTTNRLAASHIYPKGHHQKMRWNPNNVIALCWRCHSEFWHKHPLAASEWIKEVLPKERLEKLKLEANTINKRPIDYKLIKLELEQMIKKHS